MKIIDINKILQKIKDIIHHCAALYQSDRRLKILTILSVILISLILYLGYFYLHTRKLNYEHAVAANEAIVWNLEHSTIEVGKFFDHPAKSQEAVDNTAGSKTSKQNNESETKDAKMEQEAIGDVEQQESVMNSLVDSESQIEPSTGIEHKELDETEAKLTMQEPQNNKPSISDDDMMKPKIAIVVTNLGLSKAATLEVLNMSNKLTAGFNPYAPDVGEWIRQAHDRGFDVLINMPMQPLNYPVNDPGPYALLYNLSTGDNVSRANWILARSPLIVGVYSPIDETFTNSKSNIAPIFDLINKQNLSFLYGDSRNLDSLYSLAVSQGVKFGNVNVVIDKELNVEEIKNNLTRLENISKVRGQAIGMLGAYPISLSILREWMDDLSKKEIVIVPMSFVLEEPIGKNGAKQ